MRDFLECRSAIRPFPRQYNIPPGIPIAMKNLALWEPGNARDDMIGQSIGMMSRSLYGLRIVTCVAPNQAKEPHHCQGGER